MPDQESQKEEMVRKVKEWASSSEGKKSIEEAFESAQRMKEELRESRKIEPSRLNEPITL